MVQATVAAHISAICTGALRHREDIIETTCGTFVASCAPQTEGLTAPAAKDPDAATSRAATNADRGGRCVEDRAGEVQECSGEGGSADVNPVVLQQKNGSRGDHGLVWKETEKGEESEDRTASAATPFCLGAASITPNTLAPGSAADDDIGHNEDWWEEDDEAEEECQEGGRSSGVAGLNKLWGGTAARTRTAKKGARGGGAAGNSRWIRRREREAPFLRLLVSSQVLRV